MKSFDCSFVEYGIDSTPGSAYKSGKKNILLQIAFNANYIGTKLDDNNSKKINGH